MSPRLRAYVVSVVVLAAALLWVFAPLDSRALWGHYFAWMLICALSESMWLRVLSGEATSSMGSTAGLATVVLWGQGPSMWIAAVSTLAAELVLLRKPWVRAVFNSAQITVTMWVGGAVFALLGGPLNGLETESFAGTGGDVALRLALPIAGLFVSYLVVNRALVSGAVALSAGRPYLRVLREDWFYRDRLLDDAAAFLLSPLMVISFKAIDYVGVALFYIPLRIIHESTQRYNELQNAQRQIIHTERMAAKGEMAAEVGHELRNQLVAISGRAQMLMRDAERGRHDNVPRHAEIILEQSRRMEGLSKGLMDFSRAELHIEPVDMNALVQKSVEFVRTQNRFDTVEWDLRLAEPSPVLQADPGQLQQVLLNLFINAADAMNEKGTGRKLIGVTSSVDERRRQMTLVVTDTGTGIAAPNLARIFEPRFTTKATGHGFGLSTSYRIVTNHGGRIVAESPPGQGACFTMTLPLNRDGGLSWGR